MLVHIPSLIEHVYSKQGRSFQVCQPDARSREPNGCVDLTSVATERRNWERGSATAADG